MNIYSKCVIMIFRTFVFIILTSSAHTKENLHLVETSHSDPLESYDGYKTIKLMYFNVDNDIAFASFRFQATYLMDGLFIPCENKKVLVYMKHASIPVLNPNNANYPGNFILNFTQIYIINFSSNGVFSYINMTRPTPGTYYAIAFHPYVGPRKEITPKGLDEGCKVHLVASLFIRDSDAEIIQLPYNDAVKVDETEDNFKIELPTGHKAASFKLFNLAKHKNVTAEIYPVLDYNKFHDITCIFNNFNKSNWKNVWLLDNYEFILKIFDKEKSLKSSTDLELEFNLPAENNTACDDKADCCFNSELSALLKVDYNEIELAQTRFDKIFHFTYTADHNIINLSSNTFVGIKFHLEDVTDTGGTLHVTFELFEPVSKHYVIVACLERGHRSLPQLNHKCTSAFGWTLTAYELNQYVSNISKLIPYPEGGDWYLTFRLFCHESERNWADEDWKCSTDLKYDITSYDCIFNGCGDNGECIMHLQDGTIYSICVCWDCSDDRHANSFIVILLETILLTLSNLAFLPVAVIAFYRQYYVHTSIYLLTCIFSILYHACDSGEGQVSFCIINFTELQFADFYCAATLIWITLIAMAYLSATATYICTFIGILLLGVGTYWDKQSFALVGIPFGIGVAICAVSWLQKSFKLRTLFPAKHYWLRKLPIGGLLGLVAISIYAFCETDENYKYTHSLWHILIAATAIMLLPNECTFIPQNHVENDE